MTRSLRKLFDSQKQRRESSESVKVLVTLDSAAKDTILESLRELGLRVTAVTGNKLTGDVSSDRP